MSGDSPTEAAPDYRDLVIEGLAADVVDARAMVVGYRELAQLALAQLASMTGTVDRQRKTIAALRDELLRYTRSQVAA